MTDREDLEKLYLATIAKLDKQLEKYPRLKYAMSHHHNIRGEKMSFHDMPYLFEIYKDDAPEVVLQSSVQTGKSEFLIVASFAWAEKGLQCMYVLPTTDLRNLFVANRIDKLFETVPHYRNMLVHGANVAASRSLKHFGMGSIFYAGSNSATTFIEKPLDLILADEIDRFDLANYEKADDRLTASPYKLKYEASNPTVDKFGINRRYMMSDQREFFVKCHHCNTYQPMDWFKNVVRQMDDYSYMLRDKEWDIGCDRDINVYCIKCHKPINRYTMQSCWVPAYENKQTHGYLIHQMLSKFVKISKMWEKFQLGLDDDTTMQVFYNSMLGKTFAGKGAKLTDEILNACKEDYVMPIDCKEPCVMGVDVGKKLNVVVRQICEGERFRLVFAGIVREFEELDALFKRFNIVGYVIDAMPETRNAKKYADKHIGRGWICRYVNGLKEVTKDENERIVSADRTMLMDKVQSRFVQRRFINPRNAQSLDGGDYYDQMKTPTRIYDEERNRYDWLGDPDHYFHAEVYCLLAYACRGEFIVRGISMGSGNALQINTEKPENFKDLPIPPNASKTMIEHYKRMFEKSEQLIKRED